MTDVSAELAAHVVSSRFDAVPADVVHEARRALLNYVGCAIGGAREDAVEIALRALGPCAGPGTARILGRDVGLDPLTAALVNGIASHVHDFDDTTPGSLSHTTSPVASALISYAGQNAVSGRDFVHAFVLGFEAASRVASAVSPAHYEAGWHITGTVGVIGAAAAIGRLRGLTATQMVNAFGIAATQAAGLRVVFGSMAKSCNPGRAAQGGYMSALLAAEGFTAGSDPLGGVRGFCEVFSPRRNLARITDGLGGEFELRHNTYKPFPCGLVTHPAIEACILARSEHRIDPERIASVHLSVAPIVLDLCNKKSISTGLEGKFSVYHGAALGLVRGKAGLAEFTDEAVNDPFVRKIRERMTAEGIAAISEDAVVVEIVRHDGRRIIQTVEHATGSIERPMSDAALETKFRDQVEGRVMPHRVEALIDACWRIDQLENVGVIAELAAAGAA